MTIRFRILKSALLMITTVVIADCSGTSSPAPETPAATPRQIAARHHHASVASVRQIVNVYAATDSTQLDKAVADIPERVYVPNNLANTVDVIDPNSYKIIGHFSVGRSPQHITPSWDFKHLYVNNTSGNTLTVIDPRSGQPIETLLVADPYNLYFTPDGTKAIVVAERERRLEFCDTHTWKVIKSVPVRWRGLDHLDFSADGRYLLASTEFSGELIRVDVASMAVTGEMSVGGLPVDVRLAPDGSVFFVANQSRNGVSLIDAVHMREIAFLPTGRGAHGLSVSRDAKSLYVSNRREGTISVVDFATRRVSATWPIGGSPDMLQLSPDGRQLWASNRYHGTISVIDTSTGQLLHVIKVGAGPHGLAYFPQPGRYSLGHNGIYR